MPLPVIANTFRVTFDWTRTAGVNAHNVIHVQSTTSNESDISASVNTNLTTNMLAPLADFVTLDTLSIIKLDGTSAQQVFPGTSTADGQGTAEAIPASAAVLSLHTAQRGPRGRGRLFLGPTTEGNTNQGFYSDTATRAIVVAAWEAFDAALLDDGIQMGVASYSHADFHPVLQFSMRPQVGTMRRRQNQLL